MLLAELLPHLDAIQVSGPVDRLIRRVTHDSREAAGEDVFVAIRGGRVDGRSFAPLLDVAAIIADGPVAARPGVTVIEVADARRALATASAAIAGFPGRDLAVVGITGTNGKTTTSWMIEAIAEAAGLPVGVIGTTGFRVRGHNEPANFTTPEAPALQGLLARMRDAGCRLVAMEVSSIGLALHRADAIPYRVALFTNFTQDHLDFHGTMGAYLDAKRRLFAELLAPEGTAVGNADDPAWAELSQGCRRTLSYGRTAGADIHVGALRESLDGTHATVRTPQGAGELFVRLPGAHNVDNALAALGAALALEIPLEVALRGLAALERVPGRLDPVPCDLGFHVFVDYAHTPDALERVLATLRPLCRGRVLTVFGCGGDRDRGKRPLMGRAASAASDLTVLTSDNPRSEDPIRILDEIRAGVVGEARVVPDRAKAIALAINEARAGDVVLIAGKGHESTQTIGDRVLPFDDRQVAAAAIAARRRP